MIKYFTYIIFTAWMLFQYLGGCGKNNYGQPIESTYDSKSRTTAVIYAHYEKNSIDIRLQEMESRQYRVIYRTSYKKHAPDIPDEFGFLPSPNGKWILIWENINNGETTKENVTSWKILEMPGIEIIELGRQLGRPALLPYWESPNILLMKGENKVNKYDLSIGTSLDTLPNPISNNKRHDTLIEYCSIHLSQELELLSGILGTPEGLATLIHPSQSWELRPKEYLLLRTLGIPGLGSLESDYRQLPQVSFSPDNEMFAFTDAWEDSPTIGSHQGNQIQYSYKQDGTRIEVWTLTNERIVWQEKQAQEFHPRSALTQPPQDIWNISWFVDPRWSQHGKYLSYSILNKTEPRIRVIDTNSWRVVFDATDSVNPFVIQTQE